MNPSNTQWQPATPLTLTTASYVLRSMVAADVDARFVAWLADPEVVETLNLPARARRPKELAGYISRFDNRASFGLGIYGRQTGLIIGFYAIYCDLRHGLASTNVIIGDRDYWGRGVVVETRSRILDFLFDEVGVEKVVGNPFARNFPAVFNYKALGFRCEGVLRQQRRSHAGGRIDQLLFGLLRDEWHVRQAANKPDQTAP